VIHFFQLKALIADAPERAVNRKQLNFNAPEGCDFCWQLGEGLVPQRDAPAVQAVADQDAPAEKHAKRMAWVWKPTPLRTHDEVKEIQEKIECGEIGLDKAHRTLRRGYKGRSPLLDIIGFDIVKVSCSFCTKGPCISIWQRSTL
jgi:hypothetical protein